MSRLIVRRAAVLGAGVMGAQIAAHLANADVPVVLFDLAAKEGDPNGIVKKALDGLKKLSPAPLAVKDRVSYIGAANYDQHLSLLGECDLIIEAIAEKMEWKEDLYRKIIPHVRADAVIASNTSGLSVNQLAAHFPAELRPRFCGIHFFNPPRYMSLVEIVPALDSDAQMLDGLETWLTKRLGKGIVRAKDTPNFVANRVGVFSMLAVMHHTQRLGLGCDEVDVLTGPKIGRPKSATFRTADVVGLDTLGHVVKTMRDSLAADPWHAHFKVPGWMASLIEQGSLGQKSGKGVFTKVGKEIHVFDPTLQSYRPSTGSLVPEVEAILKIADASERLLALRASDQPQAQLLWCSFRDIFHYCAYHLSDIADNARDVDFAMRWGFGWRQGPFEAWQAAGWLQIANAIREDIAAGRTMSNAALPDWVFESHGVHTPQGSWSAAEGKFKPHSSLPVYRRQLFPERLLGEATDHQGATVWENEGVRLWTHPLDERIAILSVKTKMHALGSAVVAGVMHALALAESRMRRIPFW